MDYFFNLDVVLRISRVNVNVNVKRSRNFNRTNGGRTRGKIG